MSNSSNVRRRRKGVRTTKKQRAAWAAQLPVPCSICKKPVMPEHQWDLDHIVPVVNGGDASDANIWPSHSSCNRASGQALGAERLRESKRNNQGMLKW